MIKVTFDVNILISSTLWEGSVAQKLLLKLIRSDSKIFSTNEILAEYQKVLKRDFEFSDENVMKTIERVLMFITLIETSSKIEAVKNDPEDNKILECGLDSHSEYIISYDKHLLNLKEFQGIKIIKPEEFLLSSDKF